MKYEKSCGCVVFDGSKVLLIKHIKGHWDLPKGHVEDGETEFETAIREVKEETNIDVEINKNYRYSIIYNPEEGIEKEVIYFIASKKSNKIISQETEVQETRWVNYEEALELITFDNAKNVLKKAWEDINKRA